MSEEREAHNGGDDVYVDSTGKRFAIERYWVGPMTTSNIQLAAGERLMVLKPGPDPNVVREYVPLDVVLDEHHTHGPENSGSSWHRGQAHAALEYGDLLTHIRRRVVRFRDGDRVKDPDPPSEG
jgi:hypothetical protein